MPHPMIAWAALQRTGIPHRACRALRAAPLPARIRVGTTLMVMVWASVNWTVQVARKPSEMFGAFYGPAAKPPAETWRQYGALFEELARNRIAAASRQQRQDLAAIIHLCGAGAGDAYARRGFRFTGGQRCGDHDPRRCLARVDALKGQFARMARPARGPRSAWVSSVTPHTPRPGRQMEMAPDRIGEETPA